MSRALGRYELLRPIARGGMAEVYLARRRAAGVEKWLVVKRIRAERAGDARFLDLFVREARLSMSLAHQNIVPVFDFGRIDDQVFLAMERIEGRDLGSSLAKAGKNHPLPLVLAAFIAAECCQALDYAHRRRGPDGVLLGIVHRDVTPRNVLLSWSGEVKLTDFGIAALAGEDAAATKMIGTPAYMAPEQARGEKLDARADVYSVGMVLREALTGVRARPGEDREQIVAAAKQNRLLPWPEGFESPLRAVVERATASDPNARYADARELLDALDELIVEQRAANKEERRSPARMLAAWLDEVWKDSKDEFAAGASGEIDVDGHLVSFMDDGELDVIGTGTARSLAATASEIEAPAAGGAEGAKLQTGPQGAKQSGLVTEPTSRPPWWIAGVGAIALGGVAFAFGARQCAGAGGSTAGGGDKVAVAPPTTNVPPQPVKDEVVTPPPAPPVKQEVVTPPTPPAPPRDAAPVKQAARPVTPPPVVAPAKPDAGVVAPPAPVQTFHVKVNIAPWADFTIDDDTTKHTTPTTVQLAPGLHQFHFSNPPLHLDKTLTLDMPAHDFNWAAGKLQD